MEEWRDIEGYKGLYQVSNTGKVKSLNYRRTGKEGILRTGKDGGGYLHVNLCKDGKVKKYKIHRLVATAFLPNSNNLPCINHKDENKENNIVSNLEWCNYSYNNTYNGKAKKAGKKISEKMIGRKQSEETKKKLSEKMINNPKISKPVIGISKVGSLIVEFPSVKEAERALGIDHSHIIKCCQGKYNSAGGYYWQYLDDNKEELNEK